MPRWESEAQDGSKRSTGSCFYTKCIPITGELEVCIYTHTPSPSEESEGLYKYCSLNDVALLSVFLSSTWTDDKPVSSCSSDDLFESFTDGKPFKRATVDTVLVGNVDNRESLGVRFLRHLVGQLQIVVMNGKERKKDCIKMSKFMQMNEIERNNAALHVR